METRGIAGGWESMLIGTPELLILPTEAEPELTEAQGDGWPVIGSSGQDALQPAFGACT